MEYKEKKVRYFINRNDQEAEEIEQTVIFPHFTEMGDLLRNVSADFILNAVNQYIGQYATITTRIERSNEIAQMKLRTKMNKTSKTYISI